MDVIILAGGKGTRLSSVVNNVPKPMAPVNGIPFLTYLLDWVKQYQVNNIILSVGYMANIIQSHYGDNFKGTKILYALETEPLGTGGGIKHALSFAESNNVLVINGDTYFPIDLDDFKQKHIEEGRGPVSIALKNMYNFDRYGSVNVSNNIVKKFHEKRYTAEGLINGGIYCINKLWLNKLNLPHKFSFETEVLEPLCGSGEINGFTFANDFIDIGIPDDYNLAQKMLK